MSTGLQRRDHATALAGLAVVAVVLSIATLSQAPRATAAPGATARDAGSPGKLAPLVCGTLVVQVGAGFASGPADAEGCFAQAFQSCAPALLIIQVNPVGPGGQHTLVTGGTDSGCVVVDELQSTADAVPTGDFSEVICSDLSLTTAGLSEGTCTGGPPLAPIPPAVEPDPIEV